MIQANWASATGQVGRKREEPVKGSYLPAQAFVSEQLVQQIIVEPLVALELLRCQMAEPAPGSQLRIVRNGILLRSDLKANCLELVSRTSRPNSTVASFSIPFSSQR